MQDSRITFIIPYHASGAGENRYIDMMKIVKENVTGRTDFSKYQGDRSYDESKEDVRNLRMDILTGKFVEKKKGQRALTEAEKNILNGNEILRQLYTRMYGVNEDGKAENVNIKYLEPSNASDPSEDKSCMNVFLSAEQAKLIMPFEYWDKTSTIENARVNGDAFVEYCESLGLRPRFSGYNDKDVYSPEMDFTNEDGYWKTLIDRRMYNADGTYHEQQAINVMGFKADYLQRSTSNQGIVKESIVNDQQKTDAIATKSAAQINEMRGRLSVDHGHPIESVKFEDDFQVPNRIREMARDLMSKNVNLKEKNSVFPVKDSNGKTIKTIYRVDNYLIYTYGKSQKVIGFVAVADRKQASDSTYISNIQNEVIDYEQGRNGLLNDVLSLKRDFYNTMFGEERILIEGINAANISTDAKTRFFNEEKSFRRINYHFGDEQDGRGSDSKGRGNIQKSVKRMSIEPADYEFKDEELQRRVNDLVAEYTT